MLKIKSCAIPPFNNVSHLTKQCIPTPLCLQFTLATNRRGSAETKMGKAQSKRSIDITTDPKKVAETDEVAGKVEKIDVDQKADAPAAVNGDAPTPKEGAGDGEVAAGAAGEVSQGIGCAIHF